MPSTLRRVPGVGRCALALALLIPAACRTSGTDAANPAGITANDEEPAPPPAPSPAPPPPGPKRLCSQAIVELFDPGTKRCFSAANGCVASDMQAKGWRKRAPADHCNK
jgi:hypothetical protein